MKRGQFGEERYEREAMQRLVRKNFHQLKQPNWKMVDARQTIEEVHEFLYAMQRIRAMAHKSVCPA